MKNKFKKFICVILSIFVLSSTFSVTASAAYTSDYPQGVTKAQADKAVVSTDKLINYAAPLLTGKSLSDNVFPMLYNSQSLSGLLVGIYSSMEQDASTLSSIGVNISVSAVAEELQAYPEVYVVLSTVNTWAEADLTFTDWGVTDKVGFATALGKILSPFNDLLYTLLCSGNYEISRFIKIKGNDGYANGIAPLLKSLGCENLVSGEQFKSEANADKSTMVKNIVLPVLDLLEVVLKSPVDSLTDILPSFAYSVENGQVDEWLNVIISPITSNPLIEIAAFFKIIDLSMLEQGSGALINSLLTSMGAEGGFKFAEIDFARLSKCGAHNGTEFVSDKGRAYVEIMRWLVDSLKLNEEALPTLFSDMGGEGITLTPEAIKMVTSKATDGIVGTIILLFDETEPGKAEDMIYPAIVKATVQYTPNLTMENYEKVLKEIDSLLDDFVKEGGSFKSVKSLLSSAIYSNKNINSLLTGIYGAFEKEGMSDLLILLGIDITPNGVAAQLTENNYQSAVEAMRNKGSWANVSLNGVSWGFYDGSRNGFENALIAVLRPLYPLLRVILADEDMTILDSITIKGAPGYNDAIIPLLEALGCKASSIKSYDKYSANANTDDVLRYITNPVFDLLDDIFEKPVDTLTEKLPNIIYFINSGSLEKCINNLLLPVTTLTNKLSGIYEVNLDVSTLTKQLDLNALMKNLTAGTGMTIAEFDINILGNMGTKTELTSKRVVDGKQVNYSYIQADRTGVLMTLLRVLAKTLKTPGNENLLMGSMGGSNATFETYSASISEQFATMTEDELIEWLYNLLFKERAQIEIVVDENYSPTIIFAEPEKDYTPFYIAGGYLAFSAIVIVIMYLKRKRLYY